MFYVGNQGHFDAYVYDVLRHLQTAYPHIRLAVVLAYLPTEKREGEQITDTMFSEGLELVHPRYAIDRRNKWMLQQADVVICYIRHSWGGAARYVAQAQRKRKQVIYLAEPL